VLDDGDVVDGRQRELSAVVTRRALDSARGKKIGKGGRSNGGQHWARSRGDSGTTATESGGWLRTSLCRVGKRERDDRWDPAAGGASWQWKGRDRR
jgi:hypothetical protein